MSKEEFQKQFEQALHRELEQKFSISKANGPVQGAKFDFGLKSVKHKHNSPLVITPTKTSTNIINDGIIPQSINRSAENEYDGNQTFNEQIIGAKQFNPKIKNNPKQNFAKNGKTGLLLSIFLLIVSVIFFTFAIGSVSLSAQKSHTKSLGDCRNMVNNAKNQGLDLSGIDCGGDFNFQNVLTPSNQPDKAQKQILAKKKEMEDKISQLDNQITTLTSQLDKAGITLPLAVEESESTLGQILLNRNNYLADLEATKTKEFKSLISDFEHITKVYTNTPITNYKTVLENFQKQDENTQLNSFKELKSSFDKLRKEITTASGEIFWQDILKYKYFESVDFYTLYESMEYENTVSNDLNTGIIDGSPEADAKIIQIAQQRGFKKRDLAVEDKLITYENHRMQTPLKASWQKIRDDSKKANLSMVVTSIYRSSVDQKSLFAARLKENFKKVNVEFTIENIVNGKGDEAINNTLKVSAIPDHSRHHTGYTIDFGDITTKEARTNFGIGLAYKWLAANNFLNAKRAGLIPSYPENLQNVGPEPESWEYVWVGEENLVRSK